MIELAIVRQKYNPHGGAERFVSGAMQALAARGMIHVTLLARQWQEGYGWSTRRIDPFYLSRLGRDRGFARAAAECFGEFDLVQTHERIAAAAIFRAGDGVHASWLEQLARIQGPAGRLLYRISPYHRYVLAAETALFRHPALRCVICNSRMVAADICGRFDVDEGKLELVYNGVDTTAFHPDLSRHRAEWRRSHAVPEDKPLLAYVGSGFLRKGVATALAAIAPFPQVHLAIAGMDKRSTHYQRLAARQGIAGRVRFLGAVADVRPLYGAADAVILPTLYDPFPNVCLEALACGLPLFTSPTCGAAEWLRGAENGWVIDALDVAGYRHALADWLARSTAWPALRAAARKTAEPHTIERMADQLAKLYARLLQPSTATA